MNKKLHKLSFVYQSTADLLSFARLIWNSKRLRWSKTASGKVQGGAGDTVIFIKHPLGKRALHLRTFAGDIDIFYEIFFKEIYRLPSVSPANVKTVVDLGANVGLSTLYLLQEYPQAQVVCVEPDACNFKMLHKNISGEIQTGKIQAWQLAAMGEDGFVAFESADAKFNSRVIEDGANKNIPCISMPTLMKHGGIDHIDILKIDVEGAEKYIFAGNLEWLQQVDNILLETHSEEDHLVCMKAFAQHHFVVTNVSADAANEHLWWASRGR